MINKHYCFLTTTKKIKWNQKSFYIHCVSSKFELPCLRFLGTWQQRAQDSQPECPYLGTKRNKGEGKGMRGDSQYGWDKREVARDPPLCPWTSAERASVRAGRSETAPGAGQVSAVSWLFCGALTSNAQKGVGATRGGDSESTSAPRPLPVPARTCLL